MSEGWVRCGQCQEIFHGVEALFELPGEPASVAPTPSPPEVAPVPHTPASTFGARVAARMAEPTEREREHEGEHERQHEHEHEHEREQGQGHGHEQEHVGVQAGEAHAELDHLIVDEDSVSETAITWLPDAPGRGRPAGGSTRTRLRRGRRRADRDRRVHRRGRRVRGVRRVGRIGRIDRAGRRCVDTSPRFDASARFERRPDSRRRSTARASRHPDPRALPGASR